MILDFLYTIFPFIAAYFIFFIFSYLLFNKIFKKKWNIFIHSGISFLMIIVITIILYSAHKLPEQKEEVTNYLNDNKEELVEIEIKKIEKKEINFLYEEDFEIYKIIIDNLEAKKANLHQMEDIQQTTLLLYSKEAKELFKNKNSFFVSKEKLPFISNEGLLTIVFYFCNDLYNLTCFAVKGDIGIVKENKNKIQIYTEF